MALALVQLLCFARSGSLWFLIGAIATVGVLAGRLWLGRLYASRVRGMPADWARRFTWGAAATGVTWGLTSFAAVHWLADPPLQMVAVSVQAGWVSGLSVRNAASPATVLYQSLATMFPVTIAYLISGNPFLQLTSAFFVLQLWANLSVAQYLGGRTLSMLLAEQAVADSNAKLSEACDELEEANDRLQRLSNTDGLTGIGNRRAFDAMLAGEWARASRDGLPLSLLLFDVDMFKAFNDLYGHPAGDDCLRMVAGIIGNAVRQRRDFAGRFGGEEFVVLLPGTDLPAATLIADRLRQDIAAAGMAHRGSPFGAVTVSAGAACASPVSAGPDALIAAADRALYRAKQNGRNRVDSDRTAAVEQVGVK